MSSKYKAIFKLKKMLEKENIPFKFCDYSVTNGIKLEHYQIIYPATGERWISVIEGFGTYGNEVDKLEIMGGFTPLEVFERRNG